MGRESPGNCEPRSVIASVRNERYLASEPRESEMERRLAAILVADMVGYSRLIAKDEAGTLAALKIRQVENLEPLIVRHKGRLVKLMGDGFLLEFASAVSAVQCAVDLQTEMAAANSTLAEDEQIVFRIGVNLGEVAVEGDDIFGDGVNVAARLEAICEPGGVCLSDSVYRQIRGKTGFLFVDLGEQNLKNIAEPVRAYQVKLAVSETGRSFAYNATPSKPSIAVLPFANLSGDPEQDYFADGITEDIITELSRFSSLFVIARNSSFQYRGKSQDIKKVGRELGVRYLVEGSVRRLGPHIRITAQLIDATSGRHEWAERYDRRMEDLFEVQDEVVRAVVTCSEHRIADREAEQVARRPPDSWLAYDYCLQARQYLARYEHYPKAEAPLLRAIAIDPTLAEAYSMLAHVEMNKFWQGFDDNHIEKAHDYARQSMSVDPNHSDAHSAMSLVYAFQDNLELALLHMDRALVLNPYNSRAAINRAQFLAFSGQYVEALAALETFIKRDPIPPTWYWEAKGSALFQLRQYQQAIDAYTMAGKSQSWEMAYLAASLAYLDRMEEARQQIVALLAAHPMMTISKVLKIDRWRAEEARNHLAEGLRRAGLPDDRRQSLQPYP
jgi:adenylate cyclase